MKARKTIVKTLLLLSFSFWLSCDHADDSQSSNGLFELMNTRVTGIDFINEVQDQKEFNILTYRNFYNGGGVAIGDVNNDGLQDLFFTSNLSANQLYLNLGDWKFENISESAGIEGTNLWSTGVTFVDINGDGLQDIYVCNSGDVSGNKINNELFINQGDLTFIDRAGEYGLNDQGYSTHASFFDYDLDGDLDCFVLNNSYTDPEKIGKNASRDRHNYGATGGDRLYENQSGNFVDVTEKSKIYSGDIDFGLGVSIGDVNGDLFPDIYVSNDFWERDYLYLNNGDKTFSEVLPDHMDYVSANSMGADIADINNDGHLDIFSTDMLPAKNYRMKSALKIEEYFLEDLKMKNSYFFQFIQNGLHLNRGDGTFQEMSYYAGVAATDWSWGSLIFDMDNDGLKDIFVSNGIYHDITDLDFIDFLADEENVKNIVKGSGRVDFRDFVKHLPHNQQPNFAFKNMDGYQFENKASDWNLAVPSYSNGSAYGDLDNDGDYDLVVNNVNMEAFIYKNNSANNYLKLQLNGSTDNILGIGARVSLYSDSTVQVNEVMQSRGFQSSVDASIIFGLGNVSKVDSITIEWPKGGIQVIKSPEVNTTVIVDYEPQQDKRTIDDIIEYAKFEIVTEGLFATTPIHIENDYQDFDHERLIPHKQSEEGPQLLFGDLNGDAIEDMVMLGAADDVTRVYMANGKNYVLSNQEYLELDKVYEDVTGALFDADADGDLDLMIGVGGNEYSRGNSYFMVRLYRNNGKGQFERELINTPPAVGHIGCITPGDFDNDGDMDVFIGAKSIPGAYGLTPRSYLYRNDGSDGWTDITTEDTGPIGMVTDAIWTDLNDDDWEDLIVVGEWMPITIYVNTGDNIKLSSTVENSNGWWNDISMADIDDDGDQDYILGNWGENMKFSASIDRPLTAYFNDFDQNGRYEGVIEWYFGEDDQAYPFHSKMDLTSQLPGLKKNNIKYSEYAKMKVSDMFSPTLLQSSIKREVFTFSSSILKREGNFLELHKLPREAQMSPIFASAVDDIDGDGNKDLFIGGNFYGLKPEVGRHDGFNGGYFKGDGKGSFSYITAKNSGIEIRGEVRDAHFINSKLFIAKNDGPLEVFSLNK